MKIRNNVKSKYRSIIKHIPRVDILDCLSKKAILKILYNVVKVISPDEFEKYKYELDV